MKNISEQYINQLQSTLGKLDQALGRIDESIIWLDENGIIAWSNIVFNELTQRIRIEVLGQNINDVIDVSLNNENTPIFNIIKKVAIGKQSEICILSLANKSICLEISANKVMTHGNNPYFIAVLRDVTEREKLHNDLFQKDKKLSDLTNYLNGIIESMSNMLIVTSPTLEITFVNKSTIEILGYLKEEDLIGQPLQKILSDASEDSDTQKILLLIQQLMKSKSVSNKESFYQTKSGEKIPVLFSASILKNVSGNPCGIVCVAQDILQLKKAKDEIIYLASHDALTDLPNRSEFEKVLDRELARSIRHKKIAALLFIDIDNFKHINDSLGHHTGDQVLIKLSERLLHSIRPEDIAARFTIQHHFLGRLGGDEFIILLSELQHPDDAGTYAKRLMSIISKPININEFELHITVSIGIAIIPNAGTTAQTLIKNADIAMYRAKEMGKNRVEYHTESLNNIYKKRLELENGLHKALEEKNFYLVYQPQYHLITNKVRGFEALLRWKDSILGQVSPNDFISIAEKSGLIIPIGEWVIKEACRQLHQWQSDGIIQNDLKLSINISPYQLIKEHFVKKFSAILNETNINPNCIELEITETALMTQLKGAESVLNDLKQLGITLSIDEFGTGYSSLTRIKELPINTLKIDKSFIDHVTKNKNASIIVKSIIALAKALELAVVAEGAENKKQIEYLLEMGCEFVQGFYFSKPLDKNEVSELLRSLK